MKSPGQVFRRSAPVRVSTTLLAVLFAITVVGLIPAVWMLLWAWGGSSSMMPGFAIVRSEEAWRGPRWSDLA